MFRWARPQPGGGAALNLRAPSRRRAGSSGPEYLLDYADGTFTRSSEAAAVDPREGWSFYDLVAPWKATNVPRILPDGAVLIEESRTNRVENGRDLTSGWGSSGTVTANYAAGPDGIVAADRVEMPSGVAGRSVAPTITAGPVQLSVYTRAPSGTASFQERFSDGSGGIYALGGEQGTDWTRRTIGVANAPNTFCTVAVADGIDRTSHGGVVAGDRDEVVDLIQLEEAVFPSSPIRTAGAAATRATEAHGVRFSVASLPAGIVAGRWAVDVWPCFSDAEATGLPYIYQFTSNAGLAFRRASGVLRLTRFHPTGGLEGELPGLTFSRFQKLTIVTDEVANTVTLTGATTGNGTMSFLTNITAGTTLTFGCHAGVTTREVNAVIGRPVAA